MAGLRERYEKEIIPTLLKTNKYKNKYQIPRLRKVVINRGVGEVTGDSKAMDVSAKELVQITGQKPLITLSKKSIAAFKLRQNQPVGCKVTLRGRKMYDFLEKFINICLPRIRDFKGVSPRSFDGRGNYSLGIREQLIFPEIEYDRVDAVRGMDITIETSTFNDGECRDLLEALGMPFRKDTAATADFNLPGGVAVREVEKKKDDKKKEKSPPKGGMPLKAAEEKKKEK